MLGRQSVFDSITAADLKAPSEASLINILGQMREHMACRRIRTLFWIDTRDMLADGLNKGAISRKPLMQALMQGIWRVIHPLVHKLSRKVIINEALDDDQMFEDLQARTERSTTESKL